MAIRFEPKPPAGAPTPPVVDQPTGKPPKAPGPIAEPTAAPELPFGKTGTPAVKEKRKRG